MRTLSILSLVAIAALGCSEEPAAVPARASELSEIRDTQKKILERLGEQDKVLKDIQSKVAGQGGGRPQVDPNKIYDIPLGDSAIRGPKNARVTIVEFSDFQCPFCAQTTPIIDQVLAAYPKDVRLVYKQFPLEQIHPNAMPAAKATIAARNQGKFWEMHDELFKISRNLAADEIRKKAELLGLDLKKFDTDMTAPETEKAVRDELAQGRGADVSGTPTLFVNGKRVPSQNRSVEAIKGMIDEALKKG